MNELGQKTKNLILIWHCFNKGHTKLVKVLILGLLLIKILHPESSLGDAESIFKESNGAVVVIITYGFEREPIVQGSGFAVRQDGVIVTSYHVINKSTNIEVKVQKPFGMTESLKVEGLIYIDKDNDLAILKVPQPVSKQDWVLPSQLMAEDAGKALDNSGKIVVPPPLEKFPVVKLGDIDKVNIGEKVYVISSPQGLENTISEGILSGLRDFRWERPALLPPIAIPKFEVDESGEAAWLKTFQWERKREYRKKILQFTAPISPGSSGGPVFNKNGEVIGIVTFLIKGEQNLNFAMPVNLIKDEIENKEVIPLKEFQKEVEKEYIKFLAETLAKTQDWSKAKIPKGKTIEVCKEVLILDPNHGQARFHLVIDYYLKGEKEKALEHYRILKKVDPYWARSVTLYIPDRLFK